MDEKDIQIVQGDGNIEISPAEDHIGDMVSGKKPKKEDIVIPEPKKNKDEQK